MAQPSSNSVPFQKETTFSNYNHEQGKTYAENRRNYDTSVYQAILDFHTSTGGKLDTLLDVGCGPGLATYSLAPDFAYAIGLDPSEGMLSNARALGSNNPTLSHVQFEISTAEELGSNLSPPIPDASVDLITAANAAHWFDMRDFWPSAARVLKAGGTVAIWTSGPIRAHPSMPYADAIDAAMDRNYENHLKPYDVPGSVLTRNRYTQLLLPWTLEVPIPEFPQSEFVRKEWETGERFFTGQPEADLETFEKAVGTGSAVTRWRQAHPELVGTEKDVVRVLRKDLERILREAGVEKGQERLKGDVQGVLLMVKKRA